MKLLTFVFIFIASLSFAQSPGNCLHFNGTNNNVSTALPVVFNNIPANNLTVEAWVYPEGNDFSRILYAQLNPSSFVSLSIGSGNLIFFYVSNVNSSSTTAGIPANQWTHVACTWNATTQEIQIFFDGILQTVDNGGSSSTGNDNIMTIGSRTNNAQYFLGRIDELRIWDAIRTQCEIHSGMTTEFTVAQTNLVAYYQFNQGNAGGSNAGITTLPDFTGSYNGTLNGFGLSGTTSNWIISGATITSANQNGTIFSVDTIISCSPIFWIDGNEYSASNDTATFNIVGGATNGCDSLVTLNLTINNVSDITTTTSGITITANNINASYQWVDCNNSYAVILGETNQSYTPTINGSYAVELTENGCVDTSDCVNISTIGIIENSFDSQFTVYPNPTNGKLTIVSENEFSNVQLTVRNALGQAVVHKNYSSGHQIDLTLEGAAGIYFIEIIDGDTIARIKVIKE